MPSSTGNLSKVDKALESQSDDNEKVVQTAAPSDPDDSSVEPDDLRLTQEEQKKLLRRIDLWIIPYASLIYLLSFLDRVNIGQARLAGLEEDLKLHGNQFNISLSLYFVSYVVFELPSTLIFKRLGPRWICFIMVCWSIAQICMGLVRNASGLYALRLLLGLFEAGLFPGLNLLFITWYTRKELNTRISIFVSGSTLAGAFGGLLAFAIRNMAGIGGKGGWAWIFIIEGLLTLLCAILAYWLVPDFPEHSRILNKQERAKWLHRLTESQGVTNYPLPFTKGQVIQGLTDWKTYIYGIMFLSVAQPFYSLSLFVPTIIAALGFTNAKANLLSAAPYAFGFIFTMITAVISDRYSLRGPIIIVMMILTIIGYAILLCDVSAGVKYFAVFIAVSGTNPSIPAAISYCGNNFGPVYTRTTVMGIVFTVVPIGAILSSNVYPVGDAPRYIRGHTIAIAFSVLALVLSIFLTMYNRRENARRDALYGVPKADGSDCNPHDAANPLLLKKWGLEGKTSREMIELGDRHPAFRYML